MPNHPKYNCSKLDRISYHKDARNMIKEKCFCMSLISFKPAVKCLQSYLGFQGFRNVILLLFTFEVT